MTDTRRRVKLYELNAERQWDDKGTGENLQKRIQKLYQLLKPCVINLCGEAEGDFFGGAQRGGNNSSTGTSFFISLTL